MRKAVQLAGLARAAVASGQLAGGALAGPSQQLALAQAGVISRSYAGGGVPEEDPYHVIHNPTLLQKVAPLIFKTPFKLLRAAVSGAKAGVIGLAHSGPVKSLVTSVGDSLVVHEKIWELKDLDVAYWAYTLTQSGYSDKAGVQKMVNAAKAQVPGMDASQLAMLMDVCAKFGVGDRELFGAVAAGVKEHWTKLSTPEALTVIHAFSSAGHYDRALFDDLADSIAYCNHFFSATLTDPLLLSRGFAAYAKAGHERADLLIQLSRGILDENIDKLPSAERREAVMNILRCFDHFNFWPEVTQHLLVLTKLRAADFTPQDMTDVQAMVAKVQDLFGPLTYYDGGYKNPSKHFHDHAKHPAANYQMHVFRDELMPKAYSPASVRPMRD